MKPEELEKLDDAILNKKLLVAEIMVAKAQSGIWSQVIKFTSLLSALGALIAALVALHISSNDNSKKLVEIHKEKEALIKLINKHKNIKSDIKNSTDLLSEISNDVSSAKAQLNSKKVTTEKLEIEARSYLSALANLKKNNSSGLNVDIKLVGRAYSLFISTFPEKAKISIYYSCNETFIFPVKQPDPVSCEYLNEGHIEQLSPFEVDNLHVTNGRDNHYWIVADFGTHKVTKLINLKNTYHSS